METNMMNYFKNKFMNFYDTPMVHDPLTTLLGQDGISKGADDILQGRISLTPCISPHIIEFFYHLKITNTILDSKPIKASTTFENFKNFWKKGRERISSSMLGIHNGHYVAAAKKIYIGTVTSLLSSIPWEMGFSLERWRNSLKFTLEKLIGVRHLSKVHTIHLLEADYNTGTKHIFSHRETHNAQQHSLLPDSQYAKRHSREIEGVVLKRLFFDLCRITKTPAAALNLYARVCYYILSLQIGSMELRRLVVPKCAIRTLFNTQQRMRNFIRTGQGDSEGYYEGTQEKPLQGGGQGNAAAGPMWKAISIVFISIIVYFWVKSTFVSAISLLAIQLTAIIFVDDTELFLNATPKTKFKNIGKRAQLLVTKWCDTLWVTGGCLRPEKCSWYLITFKWDRKWKWRYGTLSETPYDIIIPDDKKNPHIIRRSEIDTGMKVIGVHLDPKGYETTQYKVILNNFKEWAEKMRHSTIGRYSASLTLKTTITKSHQYKPPALTLSKK